MNKRKNKYLLSIIFRVYFLIFIIIFLIHNPTLSQSHKYKKTRYDQRLIQEKINAATEYSELIFNSLDTFLITSTIIISKPLRIKGLNAELAENLGKVPLMEITAPHFTCTDFTLTGNAATVSQQERAPLMSILAGDFLIERGKLFHSSKEGISIEAGENDLVGGVVRDIYGYGNMRDLVSINGGYQAKKVRNVLVDNIRCVQGKLRGAVEVSNGTDNITVRKVYAEDCAYAVDVQDHENKDQVNQNILIEDVYALRCRFGVRTANIPNGHNNLTLRDITTDSCHLPIQASNTVNVNIENLRAINHIGEQVIKIENCDLVNIREVTIEKETMSIDGILISDCNYVDVEAIVLKAIAKQLNNLIHYQLKDTKRCSGLFISKVISASDIKNGILLSSNEKGSSLKDVIINNILVEIKNSVNDFKVKENTLIF